MIETKEHREPSPVFISILSDDDLVVQGSSIKIKHRNNSPAHPVGTELVRRLVDDDNTTTIDFSSSAERGSGTIPENMELGTERNCSIKIDTRQVNSSPYYPPLFVLLGHEMVHALHICTGTDNPINEEARTTGIGIYEFEYFSENAIRKEHSLSLRPTY